MLIGNNLRHIRTSKGLTQKQVADACGVADATIRTYELNKANPKPATVAKIAKALDVPPSALYGIDWVSGIETQNGEAASALCESLMIGKSGIVLPETIDGIRLLAAFDRLNEHGKQEAIRRVNELAFIPEYRKGTEP